MKRIKKGSGDCYEFACNKVVMEPLEPWTLVHGIVIGQGKLAGVKIGHAWLERGDRVYDPYVGWFDLDDYYKIGQIEYVRRYTADEARQNAMTHRHYGPWDETIAAAAHKP